MSGHFTTLCMKGLKGEYKKLAWWGTESSHYFELLKSILTLALYDSWYNYFYAKYNMLQTATYKKEKGLWEYNLLLFNFIVFAFVCK